MMDFWNDQTEEIPFRRPKTITNNIQIDINLSRITILVIVILVLKLIELGMGAYKIYNKFMKRKYQNQNPNQINHRVDKANI